MNEEDNIAIDAAEHNASLMRVIRAGERAHLLTVGSPARGLCLRITMGRIGRKGKYHPRQPCIFFIIGGRRRYLRLGRWLGAGL